MKFSGLVAAAAGFASLTSAITVSYDTGYDDRGKSLATVACSDGQNGLMTKYGWSTVGNIPSYPYVGGYQGVSGWNSPQCGTCYGVTYNGRTIYVLAIDFVGQGFNIAKAAMNDLTNGQAEKLGRINAAYTQVPLSNCKL